MTGVEEGVDSRMEGGRSRGNFMLGFKEGLGGR